MYYSEQTTKSYLLSYAKFYKNIGWYVGPNMLESFQNLPKFPLASGYSRQPKLRQTKFIQRNVLGALHFCIVLYVQGLGNCTPGC